MSVFRYIQRSFLTAVAFAVAVPVAAAQDPPPTVQKLLERGDLNEAVQRAEGERENPESTFFAAQAFAKMSDTGRTAEEYGRLRAVEDDAWRAIGESGVLLAQGDTAGAEQAARRAIDANGDNPYAHYQLGLVANRQSNFKQALDAFTNAIQRKPDLAYAHYYAGTASQRLKQIAKMSEHFELFLKLAPDAPERTAVAAILRTLRPRR